MFNFWFSIFELRRLDMILLIGNFLSKHGLNPTSIEDLAIVLSEKYEVKTSSDKNYSLLRLLDMAKCVISNRVGCKLIIVDVFSTRALVFSCLIILLAKWFKIPYVPVLQGGNLPERFKKHPIIFNFLFSEAIRIISPSKYLQASSQHINSPITVIPNYIDVKKYSFKIRQEIKPNLLWVRAIHSIYNPSMAIHVLYQIRKIYPNALLCMVGPVKDNNIMEELNDMMSRLNLKNHVKFTGYLSKKQWIELSANYDIFINTTNYDNTPITVLEAMALGLPIVSTNVGGMPKLITHDYNGKLVDANDDLSMVKCIREYIDNDNQRIDICNNARKNIDEKYSKDVIIPQWIKLIDGSN